ncbi:MAG: histidinol-phosphate transaminase [bacterium]
MIKELKKLVRPNLFKISPYIPGKSKEEICGEFNLQKDAVIKMASNENDLGVPDFITKTIRECLDEIYLYPEGCGKEVCKKLGHLWGISPDNFILGNGCDEIISMICETFLNPGEEVIIGNPTFSYYEIASRISDAKCIFTPLKNYKYDLAGILETITSKTKLVFICNPNNPTGTIVTKEEVDKFLLLLPDHVIAIFDEAYAEYVDDPNFPNSVEYIKGDTEKNVIILRTFSKVYSLAGLRIGYGIASNEIIKYLNLVRKPFNVNRLAQHAALISLEHKEWLDKSRKMVFDGKEYLYKHLDKLGLRYIPTQANFLLVELGANAKIISDKLLACGIIVRPTASFGLPDFIRVTIGTKEHNKRFIEALEKNSNIFSI